MLQIFTIFLIFDFLYGMIALIIGAATGGDTFRDIICQDDDVNMFENNDPCIPNATFIWVAIISLLAGYSLHVSWLQHVAKACNVEVTYAVTLGHVDWLCDGHPIVVFCVRCLSLHIYCHMVWTRWSSSFAAANTRGARTCIQWIVAKNWSLLCQKSSIIGSRIMILFKYITWSPNQYYLFYTCVTNAKVNIVRCISFT